MSLVDQGRYVAARLIWRYASIITRKAVVHLQNRLRDLASHSARIAKPRVPQHERFARRSARQALWPCVTFSVLPALNIDVC